MRRQEIFLGFREILILPSTCSVFPFFRMLFRTAFCDLDQNKEFRATFEKS